MGKLNKLIVKSGRDLVFSVYCDDKTLQITLNGKWPIVSYAQKSNRITIKLATMEEENEFELRWVSDVKKVVLDYQEKDQLVFNVIE